MADDRSASVLSRPFARDLWRLVRIYWTSPEAARGGALLAGAVALELLTVFGNVQVARTSAHVIDVLAQRDVGAFLGAVGLAAAALLLTLFASVFRLFVRQVLEIRWRKYLTADYLRRWVNPQAYWQEELYGAEMDNPDQRIAEDIRTFVASALGLSLSLLSAVVALFSFGGILWTLSRDWPMNIGGVHFHIPGMMMWIAIVYAVLAMWVTHLVGRKLVPINYDRLRCEADFRYGLVRFRDHLEPVALSRGEAHERQSLSARFECVVANWWRLIVAQRDLSLLTMGVSQANGLVPMLAAAPSYFAGSLSLGAVTQVGFSYGQVSGALTWFVNAYQEIAIWRASIVRLSSFADVMEKTDVTLRSGERVRLVADGGGALALKGLALTFPDGRPLLQAVSARVAPGDQVAVVGPTGSGKTTLIRAIAGLWPFGRGCIELPSTARVHFLPSRPFLPDDTLRGVVSYPSDEGTFSDDAIRAALRLCDLAVLVDRLDHSDQWHQRLSLAEQQRLALARLLVHEPEFVFLDEATSALDEDMEARAFAMLRERLPKAALLTIAHRPSVVSCHTTQWTLTPQDGAGAVLAV
jgi:putative ATP-binding cassette transporter